MIFLYHHEHATAYNRSIGGRFGIRIGIDLPEAWRDDTRRVLDPSFLILLPSMAINNSLDGMQKDTVVLKTNFSMC